MYLLRNDVGLTFTMIARLLGKADHSTVVYACQKFEDDLKTRPAVCADIGAIRTALRMPA